MEDINPFGFTERLVKLEDIKFSRLNPRKISAKEKKELKTSLDKFGLLDKPILNSDLSCIAGHQRLSILLDKGLDECLCLVPELELSEDECKELLIRHNKNTGSWDVDKLGSFGIDNLLSFGFQFSELSALGAGDEEIISEVQDPVYDLSPRMSEKHDYMLIVVDNEIDYSNLCTMFNLDKVKDYKTSAVGQGRAILYKDFMKVINKKIQDESSNNVP